VNRERRYQHTQNAQAVLHVALVVLLAITLALVSSGANSVLFGAGLLIAVGVLLTHSLTVTVDAKTIQLRLGNGLIRRTIALADVEAVDPRTIDRGLPVRKTAEGWIFAVSGGDAITIRLRERGTCIVIGTDDPVDLLLAIREHMSAPSVRGAR
jgi:hypothetical protein